MNLSYAWLREFVDTDLSAHEVADVFTLLGFEVERIWQPLGEVQGVVAVRVEEKTPVEGSDKLHMCKVFDGSDHHMIICGASNYEVGAVVPGALPGAVLPGGFTIGRRKMMGHLSNGMLASAKELGIGDDTAGIWVFGDHAPALGTDIASWLGLDDWILDIDITPDSGHAATVWGLARELAAKTGAALKGVLAQGEPVQTVPTHPGVPSVTIEAETACRRFDGRLIDGVTIQPSPPQVQARLAMCGMRPINAVVDATNYGMLETGHPCHAFDADTVDGAITVRSAGVDESLEMLDGTTHTLVADDVVIADAKGAIALAGVMGGARTEVTDETRRVFVETAAWDPRKVLRSARRHQLFTEARARFERRVSAERVPLGAQRVCELITQWSGGGVVGGLDHYPIPDEPVAIRLVFDHVRRLIGMPITNEDQCAYLHAIDCVTSEESDEGATVTPPAWRPDLTIEADLIEEIARFFGYDQIVPSVPTTGQAGCRHTDHQAERRIRERLAGAGWTEVLCYPFTSLRTLSKLGLEEGDTRLSPVHLVNPLSADEQVLRTTMLSGLAEVVAKNVNRGTPNVAIFEIGHIFIQPTPGFSAYDGGPKGVALPAEPQVLALAACGQFQLDYIGKGARPVDVYDLTGALELIADALGFQPQSLRYEPVNEMPFHPGRTARIIGPTGEDLGIVGQWHPRTIKAFGLPAGTVFAEIYLDRLIDAPFLKRQAQIPSPLPGLRFDVALMVPAEVPYRVVHDVVQGAAGSRLSHLALFDLYSGESVGEGLRSLGFNLVLDDPEVQLTDEQEAQAIASITAAVQAHGWTLRSR